MNYDSFVKMVTRHAARLDVDVSLCKYKNVYTPEGDKSAGYFIEPDERDSSLLPYARKVKRKIKGSLVDQRSGKTRGIIRVATKCAKPQWIHTLAHEYCHMLQWFRDDPLYLTDPIQGLYQLELQTELEALALMGKCNLPLSMSRRWKDSQSYLKKLSKDIPINNREKEQ